MCGIAGLFNVSGEPVSRDQVCRFTDSLTHRGPDGRGVWVDGPVGLGHRRLAILDLSEAGACPMPYPRGDVKPRYWITYNGEIFNFLELRTELQSAGFRFVGNSDTEVLLAAYAQWGVDCLRRFNGMWAFAIWDTEQQSLFLARDRFGVKPLYYREGMRFAFASELKAFLELDDLTITLNGDLVPEILKDSQWVEGSVAETLITGVKKLLPGHSMLVSAKGVQLQRWWNTADHLVSPPFKYEDQVTHFRELFLDATRLRMRSDVPIGTSLSGGLDSSAVACAMAHLCQTSSSDQRRANDWRHAFIATFPGTALDETNYANMIVSSTGVSPHYTPIQGSMTAQDIIESTWVMEDASPAIATPVMLNYRAMRREGVYVSMDGHGGDELLLGYTFHLDWAKGDANRLLYDVFHRTLLPSILRNYDRCSMAAGIETRMPLMDWRLVVFAFSLGMEAKAAGGYTKRILRDAMRGLMPDEVRLRRSKIGFNSPMAECFNDGLGGLMESILSSEEWLSAPWWSGAEDATLIRRKTASRDWKHSDWDTIMQFWLRMSLVIWQRMFVRRERHPFLSKSHAPA